MAHKLADKLTYERVREVLSYEQETGIFTWLVRTGLRVRIGSVAGCIREDDGYRQIRIDGEIYLAHRLAYFWMTGKWPAETVDHMNRDRDDNRWCNLRAASYSQNNANAISRSSSKTGLKGVSFAPQAKRRPWAARICKNRKHKHLGYFATPEEAHAAYDRAARDLHGEFARAA